MCTPLPPSQPLYDQAEIPPPPPPRRNRNRRIIMLKLEPHQYSIIDDSAAAAGFGLENDAGGPSLVDRTPGQAWDGTLPRVEIPCVPISASPVDDVGTLAVDVGRLKIPQSHSAPELGWRLRPGDPRRRQMHWLDRQIRHDQALALEESPAPPRRAVSKVDPTEVGGRELQPWDRGWSLSAYLGVLAPQRRSPPPGTDLAPASARCARIGGYSSVSTPRPVYHGCAGHPPPMRRCPPWLWCVAPVQASGRSSPPWV